METDSNRSILCGGEILCIPCGDRICAVEFSSLTEICYDIRISHIPCLPERFQGVFNYKGTMLPAVRIGKEDPNVPDAGRNIVAIVKSKQYQFGILTRQEPFIVSLDSAVRVDSPEEAQGQDGWRGKGMFRYEDGLFSVLDIDGTIEELIIFR